MAEARQQMTVGVPAEPNHVTRIDLSATVVSVVVGGPLVGMMGFTLMASAILLAVASPLLLLFSPLLLTVGFVLALVMAGFGAATAMGLAGVSFFMWIFQEKKKMEVVKSGGDVVDTLTESGQRVKMQEMDFGDYLQKNIYV